MSQEAPMTDCRKVGSRLSEYLDSFLSPKDRRAVEAHLARCEPCRRLLRELELVKRVVGQLDDVDPPEGLARRIDRIPWEVAQDWPRVPAAARVGAVLAVAAALLVLVLRPTLGNRAGPPVAHSVPQAPPASEVRGLLLPQARGEGASAQWVSLGQGVPLEPPPGTQVWGTQERHQLIWQEVRRVSAASRRSF